MGTWDWDRLPPIWSRSCPTARCSGMAGYNSARFLHHLLMRHQFATIGFRLSDDGCPDIFFASLKSFPQDDPEHGLRRPPGLAGEFFEAVLLRSRQGNCVHRLNSVSWKTNSTIASRQMQSRIKLSLRYKSNQVLSAPSS